MEAKKNLGNLEVKIELEKVNGWNFCRFPDCENWQIEPGNDVVKVSVLNQRGENTGNLCLKCAEKFFEQVDEIRRVLKLKSFE